MSYGGIPHLDTNRLNSREGRIAMPVRGKRTHLYRPGTPRYGPDRRGLCGQRAKRKTARPTEVTCKTCLLHMGQMHFSPETGNLEGV